MIACIQLEHLMPFFALIIWLNSCVKCMLSDVIKHIPTYAKFIKGVSFSTCPSLSLSRSFLPSSAFSSLFFSLLIAHSLSGDRFLSIAHSLSGDRSLSIAQISLSLSRHPLLSSSFVSLARLNMSSVLPFLLSSLFFRHPSWFSLIVYRPKMIHTKIMISHDPDGFRG